MEEEQEQEEKVKVKEEAAAAAEATESRQHVQAGARWTSAVAQQWWGLTTRRL
jgi:hypothetical protein